LFTTTTFMEINEEKSIVMTIGMEECMGREIE
jgi:hypothetical protein